MSKNKDVQNYLYDCGYKSAPVITAHLIDGGFVEADPMTDAEHVADQANRWLGKRNNAKNTFDKASGWNTDSWRLVVNNDPKEKRFNFDNPTEIKLIFAALVILAKEAGIEL